MADLFFYGTLRHGPLLDIVLGGSPVPDLIEADLRDHAVLWAQDAGYPVIVARSGATVRGLLARNISDAAQARLDFYELGFGYAVRQVDVIADARPQLAMVYFPTDPPETGQVWTLDDWLRDWWPVTRHSATEVMSYFGTLTGDEVARRYATILMRASSRARAERTPAPATLRSDFGREGLRERFRHRPFAAFFTLEVAELSFRRFDGGFSDEVNRIGFVGGDAVTVLPYDPVRDRVMVVEQFRFGPHVRGDPRPWMLEPIAGRVDAGESPEVCARREAVEETGLTIGQLEHVSSYYPSPGAVTEFVYSYVGLADLPDAAEGIGGLDHEHEDIRSHVIGFDRLMALVSSGEAGCGPLVLSALWLSENRSRLRGLA